MVAALAGAVPAAALRADRRDRRGRPARLPRARPTVLAVGGSWMVAAALVRDAGDFDEIAAARGRGRRGGVAARHAEGDRADACVRPPTSAATTSCRWAR